MTDFAILHPVREIALRGQTVSVREMRWKDAVAFTEKLSALAEQFTDPDGRLMVTFITWIAHPFSHRLLGRLARRLAR